MDNYFSTRKWIFIILFAGFLLTPLKGKSIGLAFSYFYPTKGYFSSPLVPVSLKDMGYRWKYVGISSSLALYSIKGMQVKGLPFKVEEPVVGPFNSLVASVTPKLILPVGRFEFSVAAGGFAFYNFNTRLLYGNMDRAIAKDEGLDAVNSQFDYDNNLGYGYIYGGSITCFIIKNVFGITIGAHYMKGSSDLNLRGEYKGANSAGQFVKKTVNYENSRLDFRGVEFMVGITLLSSKKGEEEVGEGK